MTVRALLAGADRPGPPQTPVGTITNDATDPFRRNGRWVHRYQLGSVFRRGSGAHELVIESRRTWSAPTVRLQKDIDLSDAVAWARSVWPVTVHADCVLDDEVYDRLAWWSGADQSGLRALNELLHPQGTSES